MSVKYSNPWFSVLYDGSYYSVFEPGACNGAAILVFLEDKYFVMVEIFRPAVGRSLLEIPRGYGMIGETYEQCAYREVLEETGYRICDLTPLGWVYPNSGILKSRVRIFLGRTSGMVQKSVRDDEAVRIVLIPADDLKSMIAEGNIFDSFTLSAYALFSARFP